MSNPTKPTIIIIPGSFCSLSQYATVINQLKSHGYPVEGVELETLGLRDKAPTLYDDAASVAALATRLVDEGKDVVLVPHSYGGLVACEASKGLAKSVREKEGKKGGISRIVFVTSVIGRAGESLKDIMAGENDLNYIRVEGEYMLMDPASCAPVVFSDLPLDQGIFWSAQMPCHSAISFAQKLTYAAYKDIPTSYLVCERDKCIPPRLQNKIIAALDSESDLKVERHSVQADHAIHITQPKAVVDVVRKAIGDVE
ncbi:AB hydrolase-1 domain-containing protein [Favolaschia claudopus]|uniref:AB hydrolase-1 domain-containing protein n=1 Tax=Favolaschia claudopus TaxID=2862362 RepID=A0AAV9ZCH6_9AGAR